MNGDPCVLSVNEVRQLMASGTVDAVEQVDDINFATQPETACHPLPLPGCTDKNRLFTDTTLNRPVVSPLATTKSYPARKGFDEYYGYGRVNMVKAIEAVDAGTIPPEAEITSPEWYEHVDPDAADGRRCAATCTRAAAPTPAASRWRPGSEPNNGRTTDIPAGDFKLVSSDWCDGSTHTSEFSGALATLDLNDLKSRFPATAGAFNGPEPTPGPPNFNGRPNTEPYGFVVRVVVTERAGRRDAHRPGPAQHVPAPRPGHAARLPEAPAERRRVLAACSSTSTPTTATSWCSATSDGIRARDAAATAPSCPAGRSARRPAAAAHRPATRSPAARWTTDASHGAILASPAATDLDHDGVARGRRRPT